MLEEPKKILFLSNRGLLPIKDGHTRRSYNILKGLCEKNQVYFLSLFESTEEVSCENIRILEEICFKVGFFPAPPKKFSMGMMLRLVRSLFSLDPYTVWRHYSVPFLSEVNKLILTEAFDLIHCDILPICYTVKKRKGVVCSVTDHDVSYLKCLSMCAHKTNFLLKSFMFLEALKLKRLERTIFRHVDLGIVVSDADKAVLQKLCPEGEFFVVENGVEIDEFSPAGSFQEKKKLLWLGGFDNFSNRQSIYYFLEEIYPIVKQEVPDIEFDIVGGGVTEKLRQLAEKDASITITGYVCNPVPYIKRATVFVAPQLSGGGTKLKVIEAMAAGKAVVCTTIGCEGIKGLNGQHFLIADEKYDFAKKIVRILTDLSLRNFIQENARKLVTQNYNYSEICRKLDAKYSMILADAKKRCYESAQSNLVSSSLES